MTTRESPKLDVRIFLFPQAPPAAGTLPPHGDPSNRHHEPLDLTSPEEEETGGLGSGIRKSHQLLASQKVPRIV
jgi:hypothetical protein